MKNLLRAGTALLLCLLAFASPAFAQTTYYVTLTGNNSNDGSAADAGHAWRDISYGVAQLSAGDTLCVGAGTWNGSAQVINSDVTTVPSGTSTGWGTTYSGAITIKGCTGNRDDVVLEPPDGVAAITLIGNSPNHLVFRDLTITGALHTDSYEPGNGPSLIYIAGGSGAQYILLDNLDVSTSMDVCIYVTGFNSVISHNNPNDAYVTLSNSKIHSCGLSAGDGGHGGVGINNGYGIYSEGSHVTVEDNEFYDNPGATGLAIYGSYNLIQRNRVHDEGLVRNGQSCGGACPGGVWGTGTKTGINICSNSYVDPSFTSLPCTDTVVINNLVYHNGNVGIIAYTNSENTLIANNTVYDHPNEGISAQFYSTAPTIRNNISYSNGTAICDWANGATCSSGTATIDHNVTTDPSFTAPSSGDFTFICPGSSACDAGTTIASFTIDIVGISRPQGSAWDAGAFEAVQGSSGDPVTITTLSLPDTERTWFYSRSVVAAGGSGTYSSCSVTAGSLPTGVSASIVSNACKLTGTVTASAASFDFTLEICDDAAACGDADFTVVVTEPCTTDVTDGNWTLKQCPGASSTTGSDNATTVAVDSTGADLGICAKVYDFSATEPTFSDSKVNSWTPIGTIDGVFGRLKLYYSRLTSVGSGHTFTADTGGSTSFPALQCALFSGSVASPLDSSVTSSATAVVTLQPGNLTTTRAQDLVIQVIQFEQTAVASVSLDSSYTFTQRPISNFTFGIGLGWKTFAANSSATNPSWTWSPSADASAIGAAFFSVESVAGAGARIRVRF